MKHIYSRKSAISLCIALALQGNSAWAVETVKADNKGNQVSCPKDIKSLTKQQKAKLPAACQKKETSFLEENWEWVAGGATALAAAIGIAASSGGGGGGDSHDGGNPPDDGGNPPDDGGNPPTPPTPRTESFANGVEWNEAKSTLTINGKVWSYSKKADGTYLLTDSATGQTAVLVKWAVNKDNDTIKLTGKSSDGSQFWVYDYSGKFSKTDAANWHEGNGQQINTNGGKASGTGNSGQIISGDGNKIDNDGDNSATNGGTGTDVDGNDNTINNNGKNTADGAGSTGTDVTGGGNDINNNGDNSATNGGTGTDVDGNGNAIDNKGNNTADGEGSTGTKTDGDGNSINNGGDNSATNGGTGTDVNGNGNTIDNNGKNTADGAGSTGTDVNGNDNDINNNGGSSATNGGTGTSVDGDGNTIDNKGNNTADGAGSTGTDVTGDGNKINNEGDSSTTNGATGTDVDGNGNTIDNKGNNTTDGAGSTGTDVAGDNNTINNTGASNVTDGATGTKVSGDGNTLNNQGDMTTGSTDSSKPSTGVDVSGNSNTVNQSGKMLVGDYSTGLNVTGKSNTINLTSEEMKITGVQATGVKVSGEANKVTLTGDMVVNKDQKSPLAEENFLIPSTGINVSGTSNTVVLDGHLQVVMDTESAPANSMGSTESIQGVTVTGDNNRVDLMGGLELNGEVDQIGDDVNGRNKYLPIVGVDGKSSVYLHGDSSIDGDYAAVFSSILGATNQGYIEISEDATIKAKMDSMSSYWEDTGFSLIKLDSGSSAVNKGAITLDDMSLATVNKGSSAINDGSVNLNRTINSVDPDPASNTFLAQYGMLASGSHIVNNGSMTASILNQGAVQYMPGGVWMNFIFNEKSYSVVMMSAVGGGDAVNNGTLTLNGRGQVMNAASSTIDNYGTITADGLWKDANDTTVVPDNVSSTRAIDFAIGMGVGHGTNGSGVNHVTRTITIYNAGAAMAVSGSGNTITNQGIINLEKNENYDATKPLVGMAVYNGGAAINDTTGVININAENGQAFYSDGNANNRIINRGTINLGDGVPASADNSASVEMPELANGTIVEAPLTLDKNTAVMSDSTVTNRSVITTTGNGKLSVEGILNNESTGVISTRAVVSSSGKVANSGSMTNGAGLSNSAKVTNSGTFTLGSSTDAKNASMLELKDTSVFDNLSGGTLTLDNNQNGIHLNQDSTLKNEKGATITVTDSSNAAGINLWGGTTDFINDGTANATGKTLAGSASNAAAGKAFVWNQDDGVVNFTATATGQSAVSLTHNNYVGLNDGTMNVSGNGAIAMKGSQNAQLVNNGTINLGTAGTTESGMIAMQLDDKATADAVIENNGAINIYAKDSYAFSRLGENGRIINNGTVKLDGANSGLVKESGVTLEGKGNGGNGTDTHAATYTLPVDPTAPVKSKGLRSSVSQYTVGTNASGTAGTLTGNNLDLDDVKVDTGFTAGTSATTETFNDVFVGEDIQGAQNIQSASVVWTATGEKDASGNVDVTMTKKAYTDVVNDNSVSSVAKALDAGYTNNQLFNSLNLATSSDVTKAMKQISGSMANSVSRDARVLSNRFDMLADTAPVMKNGLSFNVVAQGDKRSELGNNTKYDMMALRQKLEFGGNQTLAMEYGIARINGDGTDISAGDNGLAGGYSQFFGLNHAMPLGENGLSWNNGLRYDVHQFESNRSISYGSANETAKADTRQQYLELRSEGRKTFTVKEGFDVAPYAGVKLRHTIEDGYQERGAGDFNLNMSSGTETAVDSVVGMQLNYAGKNGWAATATLEGGPNLSYVSTNKKASLQGVAGQNFNVDDGQKGGGINSKAQVGVKYNAGNTSAGLEAFHWKEDGQSDKGLMVNYKVNF